MKILVTGSNGMLGRALVRQLSDKYEIVGLDVTKIQNSKCKMQNFIECDITDKEKTITDIVSVKPDVIIHTAAYTDVDGCQKNPKKAQRVNAQGTATVAQACQKCGAILFYVSTDFVFDGKKKLAYIESDQPNPISVYGQSKLDGERYVQSILKEFIIVRSSWLFGQGGKNFVDVILKKAQKEKEIKVINDQSGSPTYTQDLAGGIRRLTEMVDNLSGIYHITNSGSCTWYEFAQAVKEIANLEANIAPISSEEYPSPTRRPKMSVLENRRYQERIGEKLRHWKEALREYLCLEYLS